MDKSGIKRIFVMRSEAGIKTRGDGTSGPGVSLLGFSDWGTGGAGGVSAGRGGEARAAAIKINEAYGQWPAPLPLGLAGGTHGCGAVKGRGSGG